MATTPGAFFDQASPTELSALLTNVPRAFSGFATTNGTTGADRFVGSSKSEIFVLGAGDKLVKGGSGYDAVVTDQSFKMNPSQSIEVVKLTGSTNAKVTGDNGNNNIFGNDGNNVLSGGAGKDVIVGDAGNDRIAGGQGNDKLFGGAGDDSLTGDAGNDLLDGGDGSDKLMGGAGKDTLMGGAGNDVLDGGADNDRLLGGEGDDLLKGMAGDDKLFGDAGNDKLMGGTGKDSLVGGGGADTLTGGAGKDIFVMEAQAKELVDVITDFVKGQDVIDVSGTGTKSFSELKLETTEGGTLVTAKDGTVFKLAGYDPDDVKSSFFDF
jgi:Ca2+-binding RTX toxin-like protein